MSFAFRAIGAAVLLVLAVSGCATSPVSSASAERVTPNRFASKALGTAVVTVTRDRGYTGSACATHVYVNGEQVVDLSAGQTVTLHVPVGDVIVGANPGGICGGGFVETSGTLKSGSVLRFRIGYDQNGSMSVQRTAFQ